MEARTSRVILLLLLQAVLLQSVQALSVHERRSQYVMNQNAITWHESCNAINPQNNQETRRAAVERAWEGALELISSARTRFETVTWPRINKGELDSNAQNYINIHDPAYVLGFFIFPYHPPSALTSELVPNAFHESIDMFYYLHLNRLKMVERRSR